MKESKIVWLSSTGSNSRQQEPQSVVVKRDDGRALKVDEGPIGPVEAGEATIW